MCNLLQLLLDRCYSRRQEARRCLRERWQHLRNSSSLKAMTLCMTSADRMAAKDTTLQSSGSFSGGTELEPAKPGDHLFVWEYMQDVAEFDSSTAPTRVQLYQLKKKEYGYWTPLTLTGQCGKAKKPEPDKPFGSFFATFALRRFPRRRARLSPTANLKST